GFFSFLSIRKWGITAIFATLAIGLSPWWRDIVLHPGNGFTYAFFIFASISFLWFNVPKILSSLSIGTALSIHPASIFGLPFFIYEWIRQKVSFKSLLLNFCSFLIPFTPLIAFEIITKGYIIRHWLERPASGISFGLSLDNVNHVFNMSGFSPFLWIPFIFFVLYKTTNQTKMWTIITLILLIIISFFEYFSAHYLFPFSVFISFVTVIALMQNRLGKLILIILVALFLHRIFFIEPFPPSSNRSISKVDTIVEKLHEQNLYNKSTPLAIVAVMDREVHVPQADDYHFFYRIDGYNALDISEYSKAEMLIIFVEDPTFDWEHWSTWEIDQFGSRSVYKVFSIDGIKAILYTH
ncbi:hypothetical protein COV58_02160, partial [Candidatus Roizmanbacteria bacterium CG11_big_fil_rev_8_21_14_0_20_36_8]